MSQKPEKGELYFGGKYFPHNGKHLCGGVFAKISCYEKFPISSCA